MTIHKDFPESYIKKLTFEKLKETFNVCICLCKFSTDINYNCNLKFLHQNEREYCDNLKFEKRIKDFLMGRYASKKAIAELIGEENLENILIKNGVFGQPIIRHALNENIQVSITHCNNYGFALAFPEDYPMGIDLELIDINKCKLIESYITDKEKGLIVEMDYDYPSLLTLLWTARESLSKVLRTGLTVSQHIFEVKNLEICYGGVVNTYTNFAQYKTFSFNKNGYIFSITYPKNIEMHFDVMAFNERLKMFMRDNKSILKT